MSAIKCAKCGEGVHPLELFPGNYCLACHAERWEKEEKPTGQEVAQMFRNSIRF
jgi:uncharacterized OB-fold protein